ncbi:MAG: hypothetical protein J6J00_06435 [Treponema sp.]|nr:hypothetical protein [Treponema sp.]
MKKITILLAASAVLASALLVSCGVKDYVDVTNKDYRYLFNVTGTVETTVTASGKNDDTTKDKVELSYTKKSEISGIGSTSWDISAVNDCYDKYNIEVAGTSKNTETLSGKVKDVSKGSSSTTSEGDYTIEFRFVELDGSYYLKWNDKLIPEVIDGDFDDDFTVSFTYTDTNVGDYYNTIKNARYSYTETTDPVEYADTVTTKYSFTFTRADN